MQVGDNVAWTQVSTRGRTMSMVLREGVIEKIEGDVAQVTLRNSRRTVVIALRRLRLGGEESQIGEFVGALRGK